MEYQGISSGIAGHNCAKRLQQNDISIELMEPEYQISQTGQMTRRDPIHMQVFPKENGHRSSIASAVEDEISSAKVPFIPASWLLRGTLHSVRCPGGCKFFRINLEPFPLAAYNCCRSVLLLMMMMCLISQYAAVLLPMVELLECVDFRVKCVRVHTYTYTTPRTSCS